MHPFIHKYKLDSIFLPLVAILITCVFWYAIAGKSVVTEKVDDFGDKVKITKREGLSADLPTPVETWTASKPYIVEPFAKRGELDQGILRFTWMSLVLVAQGYFIALIIGTPIGFFLGLSKPFTKAFDPIIQVLRPVSPLAWLPLGMILFSGVKIMDGDGRTTFGASDAAALFTIAICAMWPTVMNTVVCLSNRAASRRRLLLSPPQRPLSLLTRITARFLTSRVSISACRKSPACWVTCDRTLVMSWA